MALLEVKSLGISLNTVKSYLENILVRTVPEKQRFTIC